MARMTQNAVTRTTLNHFNRRAKAAILLPNPEH